MKKATKSGKAMVNKSADAKGRAMVKKYAKGGSIDGCATKGKTKAKMVKMATGGLAASTGKMPPPGGKFASAPGNSGMGRSMRGSMQGGPAAASPMASPMASRMRGRMGMKSGGSCGMKKGK